MSRMRSVFGSNLMPRVTPFILAHPVHPVRLLFQSRALASVDAGPTEPVLRTSMRSVSSPEIRLCPTFHSPDKPTYHPSSKAPACSARKRRLQSSAVPSRSTMR